MRGDAPFPYRVHGTAGREPSVWRGWGQTVLGRCVSEHPVPAACPPLGSASHSQAPRHEGMTFPIHLRGAAACTGQITRRAVPPTKMSLSSLACMTRVKSHLWESREKSVVPKGGCGSLLRPGNEGNERLRSWGVDSLACWAQWAVSPIPCHQGAFHLLPLEPCSPTPRDWG